MQRIARAWSGVLGVDVSPADVGRCMSALHLVRDAAATVEDASHLEHADGYVDITRMVKSVNEPCNCDVPNKACPCPTHERVTDRAADPHEDQVGDDVLLLNTYDRGPVVTSVPGRTHDPFIMNRLVVVLSLPLGSDRMLADPASDLRHQLLDKVATAIREASE